MKKFYSISLFLITALFGQAQTETVPKDTLNVLFVGNSYTYFNNLSHIVSAISDSTDTKLITKKSTVGAGWLREHWHGKRGLQTKQMIETGNFDVVVLQEYSMGAITSPDSLYKYVKLFADLVKSKGAKPLIFQVWAREKVPQYISELNLAYEKVAKENDIPLIPIGMGWNLSRGLRPDAPLFYKDGTHPGDLGTFLTAAIFVGCITGEVPEEVYQVPTITDQEGETIQLMRLDWLDMIYALKVAQETIDTYWK